MLFILIGVLGFLLLVGIAWELLYHRPKRRKSFSIFNFLYWNLCFLQYKNEENSVRFLYDSHFESDFLRNLKTFRIFPRCKPILWENPFCFLSKIYSCLLTLNCIRNYIIASFFSYVTPWFSQWFSWIVSLILLACLLASVLCIYGELICRSDKKKNTI